MSDQESTPRNHVLVGDAGEHLSGLQAESVDMVLTSPPYFRLRDYDAEGQLGLEDHVDQWVASLRDTAREIRRVLTPTGTLWLNLGDTYAAHQRQGAQRKSLLLGPERVALALVADGWRLRNKIVWRKTNRMPTSARDRLACSWEYIYVFARDADYFFDLDAIRIPHTSRASKQRPAAERAREAWRGPNGNDASGLALLKQRGLVGHPLGKNPGDVWDLASSNYRGSHHATFPVRLAERAIQAGCPEARCTRCRLPWRRAVSRKLIAGLGETAIRGMLAATCDCQAPSEPGLVLDPYFGVGSTALGAIEQGRDWLGIELNPAFAREAQQRIAGYHPTSGPARASPSPSAA